ncbi:hypothetical protein SY28_13385 [Meiothermus taiwanensis]|nr:hypothetical protein SY28_13385 [Meiothermus taiwanensis]KZK16700.1 hypothetical protein A3962_14430 [Meiothermus taiwanensis]
MVLLLLAGCGQTGNTPAPLQQLVQAEDQTVQQAEATLDEAISAFSDVLPASLGAQATSEPRPLTAYCCLEDGSMMVIGGPWRSSFPWSIPNGVDDLVDKPLFVVIKEKRGSGKPKSSYLGYLRRTAGGGGYEVEWYGARGARPVRTPATTDGRPLTADEVARKIKITVFSKTKTTNPDGSTTTEIDILRIEFDTQRMAHVATRLPSENELPGRELGTANQADPPLSKEPPIICCGRPKPWPPYPDWPWQWLLRNNDVVLGLMPYDNPKLRTAASIEELVGENLGMVYVRKRLPFPPVTTDCGPNRVWCPPDNDPIYNLRLVREQQGLAIQLTKLGDPSQVIATLPVASASLVRGTGTAGSDLGITDSIGEQDAVVTFTFRETAGSPPGGPIVINIITININIKLR